MPELAIRQLQELNAELLAALVQLEMRVSLIRKMEQGGVDAMPVPKFLADARAAIAKAKKAPA